MGGWRSGPNLNVGRRGMGGAGSQVAALVMGGYDGAYKVTTEKFNGTAWSYGGNLNQGREMLAACGLQSAALCFGGTLGSVVGTTESFNGTVWTSVGTMGTARQALGGAGTQSAALCFGGSTGVDSVVTEKWNGTTWLGAASLSEAKDGVAGCGIQNAALCVGGHTGAVRNITEKFDGSAWSFGGNLNTARQQHSLTGQTTLAVAAAGHDGSNLSYRCEQYQSDVWSQIAVCVTAYKQVAGCGDGTDCLRAGGDLTINVVELYYTVVPSYSWTTGPAMGTNRYQLGGAGTPQAGLAFAGQTGPLQTSEEFNGTVWAAGGSLSAAKYLMASCGTQDSAMCIGGHEGASHTPKTEKYNGTAWSTEAGWNLNTSREQLGAAGTTLAAVCMGGYIAAHSKAVEVWNGTVWAAANDMSSERYGGHFGFGTRDAAVAAGGYKTGTTYLNATENFDGTNWSAGGNLNTARYKHACVGSQIAGLLMGGNVGARLASAEKYNGSAWTNITSGNWTIDDHAAGGAQGSALFFGGYPTGAGGQNFCQIYTGPVPVIINLDGIPFWGQGQSQIIQFFPEPGVTTTSGEVEGVYKGRYFDLTAIPFLGEGQTTVDLTVMIPFDAGLNPFIGEASMLCDLHVGSIARMTLPSLICDALGVVRSGRVDLTLPALVLSSTGIVGEVGSIQLTLPMLLINALGSTPGSIGQVLCTLPALQINSSLFSAGNATVDVILPALRINAHGEFQPTLVRYKVTVMNLKNRAVSEYTNFDFNSFTRFNGLDLAARADGIYSLDGDTDNGKYINSRIVLPNINVDPMRPREIWVLGRGGGEYKITLVADEGDSVERTLSDLFTGLNQARLKIPRGLEPTYLQIIFENVNGADFNLDTLQCFVQKLAVVRRHK